MKKTFYRKIQAIPGMAAMLIVSVLALSCEKEKVSVREVLSGDRIPVTVSVPSLETKYTGTSGEAQVSDLQILVFRSDGTLDAYAKCEDGLSLELDCTAGEKEFVAVVNGIDLSGISSRSDMNGLKTVLSENVPGKMIMTGSVKQNVTTGENEVFITVSRLVARVSIAKVTNAITSSAYADSPIKITAIYLSNVTGDRPYMSVGTPSVWYNKFGTQADLPALLHSGKLSVEVPKGSSGNTTHYFYCFPNSTSKDSSSSVWCPRYTRLVVETEIAGQTYYYPVSFQNIEANHRYHICDLKITRLGSESPDEPVQVGTVTVTIEVKGWDEGSDSEVTI